MQQGETNNNAVFCAQTVNNRSVLDSLGVGTGYSPAIYRARLSYSFALSHAPVGVDSPNSCTTITTPLHASATLSARSNTLLPARRCIAETLHLPCTLVCGFVVAVCYHASRAFIDRSVTATITMHSVDTVLT